MKIYKYLLYLRSSASIIVNLSGCAAMNSDFECKQNPGFKCKSIDEINDWINEGKFDKNKSTKNSFPLFSNASAVLDHNITTHNKTIRVWNAPYTDNNGAYHAGAYLYLSEGGEA